MILLWTLKCAQYDWGVYCHSVEQNHTKKSKPEKKVRGKKVKIKKKAEVDNFLLSCLDEFYHENTSI